jgi:protein phosphatase
MSDGEIEAACQRPHNPQELLEGLFGLALGRAARDNVSAVVVQLLP